MVSQQIEGTSDLFLLTVLRGIGKTSLVKSGALKDEDGIEPYTSKAFFAFASFSSLSLCALRISLLNIASSGALDWPCMLLGLLDLLELEPCGVLADPPDEELAGAGAELA